MDENDFALIFGNLEPGTYEITLTGEVESNRNYTIVNSRTETFVLTRKPRPVPLPQLTVSRSFNPPLATGSLAHTTSTGKLEILHSDGSHYKTVPYTPPAGITFDVPFLSFYGEKEIPAGKYILSLTETTNMGDSASATQPFEIRYPTISLALDPGAYNPTKITATTGGIPNTASDVYWEIWKLPDNATQLPVTPPTSNPDYRGSGNVIGKDDLPSTDGNFALYYHHKDTDTGIIETAPQFFTLQGLQIINEPLFEFGSIAIPSKSQPLYPQDAPTLTVTDGGAIPKTWTVKAEASDLVDLNDPQKRPFSKQNFRYFKKNPGGTGVDVSLATNPPVWESIETNAVDLLPTNRTKTWGNHELADEGFYLHLNPGELLVGTYTGTVRWTLQLPGPP